MMILSSENMWPINDIPEHFIVRPNTCEVYAPIDRLLRVVRAVLYFLSDDGLSKVYRDIEGAVMMMDMTTSDSGSLVLPEGERVFVRTTTRKFTRCAQSADGADVSWDERELRERQQLGDSLTDDALARLNTPLLGNIDLVLEVIVENILSRKSLADVLTQEYFKEADENNDGVLSFDEFRVIVQRKAPHFTIARVQRMYREALLRSVDCDADSITPNAFAEVCRREGMMPMVGHMLCM